MARITTYVNDSVISPLDKLIGTDADDSNITKNYLISDLLAYIGTTNAVTKKITLTTDQLKASGIASVNIIDLGENQVADVTSVMVRVNNQSAANKLTFANTLTIEPAAPSGASYKYVIPIVVANNETAGQFYKPALDAGYSDIGPVIGDVRFKSSVAGSNPVETGTATTTLDIYVTYSILSTT